MSRPLTITAVFCMLAAAGLPYQYGFRYLPFLDSVLLSLLDAAIFTAILWMTTRLDLGRVTLCFLALPYLIFFPGWLNAPSAALLLIIFIYCLANTLRSTTSISNKSITIHDVLAFILIILWVNVSGAGGYGYQTPDYAIHNARLKDLIDYTWPVHYGKNQNFVLYFGYFLPAAIIGKLSNVDFAFRCMYPWTILGVMLAMRWLSLLSGWRFSILLVVIFIFFGPLDIPNLLVLGYHADIPLDSAVAEALVNTDYVDFRTRYDIGFIIGNYLSNTFQLFWSPHQVIAGWLGISLMTHLFLQKKMRQFIFIYTLLCLWSPLIMLAIFPFVLIASLTQLHHKSWRQLITPENTMGAGTMLLLFVIFYLGGSSSANPSYWLFDAISQPAGWFAFVLFLLFAWGIYALAITPFILQTETRSRCWFFCLIAALALLPVKIFGAYSDLLCRGSAPLMFLLLVFILQAIHFYWLGNKKMIATFLVCLLIAGTGSTILTGRNSLIKYGLTQRHASVIDHSNAYPNLGPDNTMFNRYFRKKTQHIVDN